MNLNATIVGQIIAFFLFVWFCQAYVWPPIVKALEERRKKIADGLEAASRAEHDLDLAQQRAAELLREAKEGSAGIIDQANKRANQIIDEAKDKAREQLRQQVATLAVAGAEKILQSSVDAKAHSELLNKLAASL